MSAKTEPPAGAPAGVLAFTWVDSEVASVIAASDGIEIRLSAARLCVVAEQYLPGVVVRLQGRLRAGNPQDALGRVLAASLIIQGQGTKQLAVPSQTEATFALDLWFGNGAALELEGQRLDVLLPQDPRIIERLSC